MRIVGGSLRGRVLSSFKGAAIRPTSDKVREAVFNALTARRGGAFDFRSVLDLFAGTGAMGVEALSRGAGEAVLVDSSAASAVLIRKNVHALGLEGSATVVRGNVAQTIGSLAARRARFDLVFIDPPYAAGLLDETLDALSRAGIVEPGGLVVAEASKRAPLKDAPAVKGLALVDERRYGDTLIYFFTSGEGE